MFISIHLFITRNCWLIGMPSFCLIMAFKILIVTDGTTLTRHVVVRKHAVVVSELLSIADQALLLRRNAELVMGLDLHVVKGVVLSPRETDDLHSVNVLQIRPAYSD